MHPQSPRRLHGSEQVAALTIELGRQTTAVKDGYCRASSNYHQTTSLARETVMRNDELSKRSKARPLDQHLTIHVTTRKDRLRLNHHPTRYISVARAEQSEDLANVTGMPDRAECLFAIPRWECLASTYRQAKSIVLTKLFESNDLLHLGPRDHHGHLRRTGGPHI